MMPTNIVNTIAMAAVVFIGGLSGGIYAGAKVERSIWQEKEVQRILAEQELRTQHQKLLDTLNKEHQDNLFKAEKDKDNALKTLKHDYDAANRKRLYVLSDCSGTSSTSVTKDQPTPDGGASAYVELPAAVRDDLYNFAYKADELAEDYRALRHWIVMQGLYQE